MDKQISDLETWHDTTFNVPNKNDLLNAKAAELIASIDSDNRFGYAF